MSPDDEVRGLNLIIADRPSSRSAERIRAQLKAADAQLTVEHDDAEPPACIRLRRDGEQLLSQRRYEDAEAAFLDALDAGLAADHFCWQAAVNLVNCHLFLRRLDDAEATAAQLASMFAARPEHPVNYLLATQRGAIAAERWGVHQQAAHADEALAWAREAYAWQVDHRDGADALRAYNLVAALLRVGARDEALAVYRRHAATDDFQRWCSQGEHAAAIAELAAVRQ